MIVAPRYRARGPGLAGLAPAFLFAWILGGPLSRAGVITPGPPLDTGGHETAPGRPGTAPVIDGTISNGEWAGARRELFADGSELLLLRDGDELYLGLRAKTPDMIVGNVFIARGERITIHHASAALGTAVYHKDGQEWRLVRGFSWRCRRFDDGEEARAEREAFFLEEHWIASNCWMGALHELEYRIRIPGGPFRLAANFVRASAPSVKIPWPMGLDDDCVRPTPEGLPPVSSFSPEKWGTIGPAAGEFPALSGPYLGQKRPGPAPGIFAPGILSLGFHEHNIAISPDGREIFFVGASSDFSRYLIMTTRLEAGGANAEDFDIWFVERRGGSWTEPGNLGGPVNSGQNEANPSVASDGTIYFQRIAKLGTLDWDLYRSSLRDGVYGPPEKLPPPVNTEANEAGPFIAPDGSFLLFQSNRPGSYGIMDIYATFRTKDGGWSEPINLGEKVNSTYGDWGAVVSPDGKCLFFSSFRNVSPIAPGSPAYLEYMASRLGPSVPGKGTLYWMGAGIIDMRRFVEGPDRSSKRFCAGRLTAS